ncbi:hypothetical protein [Acidianus sulfidivorans]|nr:hypothetical protein [Acidianus sulfidivorans]
MLLAWAASTYASPGSVSLENAIGFGLAGIAIVGGILFYLFLRRTTFQ